jgi:hypothetical protein
MTFWCAPRAVESPLHHRKPPGGTVEFDSLANFFCVRLQLHLNVTLILLLVCFTFEGFFDSPMNCQQTTNTTTNTIKPNSKFRALHLIGLIIVMEIYIPW